MIHRILVALSILLLIGCSSTPKKEPQLTEILSGKWSDELVTSCEGNYHSISFNGPNLILEYVDGGYISKTDTRKVFNYRMLNSDGNYLRVQLENEPRLDTEGRPVVWHIKPIGTVAYCWGRDDWSANDCTKARYRCG